MTSYQCPTCRYKSSRLAAILKHCQSRHPKIRCPTVPELIARHPPTTPSSDTATSSVGPADAPKNPAEVAPSSGPSTRQQTPPRRTIFTDGPTHTETVERSVRLVHRHVRTVTHHPDGRRTVHVEDQWWAPEGVLCGGPEELESTLCRYHPEYEVPSPQPTSSGVPPTPGRDLKLSPLPSLGDTPPYSLEYPEEFAGLPALFQEDDQDTPATKDTPTLKEPEADPRVPQDAERQEPTGKRKAKKEKRPSAKHTQKRRRRARGDFWSPGSSPDRY